MEQQQAKTNVWLGVLLRISGAATASANLLQIVDEDGTGIRWLLLAGSILLAVVGLGFLSIALRARR